MNTHPAVFLAAVLALVSMVGASAVQAEPGHSGGHPGIVEVADEPVLTLIANRTSDIPNPPPGKIALRLSVTYQPNPLPGSGITFNHVSPEAKSLWAQESLFKGEEIPAGPAFDGGVVFLEPGEERMVTVVYRNPTDEEVTFMAMPHRESPASAASGTWLTCFCLAFIYSAPPEGSFYRVIRIKLGPKMRAGSRVDALWTVLTDPAVFPKEE